MHSQCYSLRGLYFPLANGSRGAKQATGPSKGPDEGPEPKPSNSSGGLQDLPY